MSPREPVRSPAGEGKSDRAAIALVVGLLAVLLPFLALCFFAFPAADDMCFTGLALDWGQLPAFFYYYVNWGGRFFPTLVLDSLAIPIKMFGLDFYYWFYKPLLCSFFLSLPVSAYLAARSVSRGTLTRAEALAGSGLFLTLLLTGMPSLGEFYHLPFTTTYQVGGVTLVLLAIAVATPFLSGRLDWRRHRVRFGLGCLCCLLAVGSNEPTVLGLGMLAGLGTLAVWRRGGTVRSASLLLLATVLVGSALSVGAPGNSYRSSFLERNVHGGSQHDLEEVLIRGPRYALTDAASWLRHPPFLTAGLLLILAGLARARRVDPDHRIGLRHAATVAGVVAIYQVLYQLPTLWAVGFAITPRTKNAALAIALAGGLTVAFLAGIALRNLRVGPLLPEPRWILPSLLAVASLATLVAMLSTANYRVAITDLTTTAGPFAAQMHERLRGIRAAAAAGERRIRVARLEGPLPATVHFPGDLPWNGDLSEDPTNGMNACYARFYGADSMVLEPLVPPDGPAGSER